MSILPPSNESRNVDPGDAFPFPAAADGIDFSSSPGSRTASWILDLFDSGTITFWHWVPTTNRLTTRGRLAANSLEEWLLAIHPRDQDRFSAFLDRSWSESEPALYIDYRFHADKTGEWIRVRQTASYHRGSQGNMLSCLVESLPSHPDSGEPGASCFAALDSAIPLNLPSDLRNSCGDAGEASPKDSSGSFDPASSWEEAPSPETGGNQRISAEGSLKESVVLLFEDERAVRKLVRKLLERFGCTVIEATSGRQALDLWPDVVERVSLVVSDIVMPDGVSGWELAPELHRLHPKLPILLTGGYGELPRDHGLADSPVLEFLQKPYPIETMHTALRRITSAGFVATA